MSLATRYRQLAQESLRRAKGELDAQDDHRLRYAALELRDAMASLTYSRALAFREFIPPSEYEKWQPRKLMAALVDIDPTIGMTSTLAYGIEEEYGKPVSREKMKVLGTDTVLTLQDIKKHYDALGSYLHMPSLADVESGKMLDFKKLRKRCETIIPLIEEVLSSSVWNSNLADTATLPECMNEECKKPVRKRIPAGQDKIEVQCFECHANYTITRRPDRQVFWEPHQFEVRCSTAGCPETKPLWPHEIRPETNWICNGCDTHNIIKLTVNAVAKEKTPDPMPSTFWSKAKQKIRRIFGLQSASSL